MKNDGFGFMLELSLNKPELLAVDATVIADFGLTISVITLSGFFYFTASFFILTWKRLDVFAKEVSITLVSEIPFFYLYYFNAEVSIL